jgi:hypothetical protein
VTEIPLKQLSRYFAFCDPHGGGREALKGVRSRAAIVVAASDLYGRVFIFHAWADRVSTDKLMDEILRVNERFNPKAFGVEANGLQGLFGDAIARDAEMRQLRLPLVKIKQPTTQMKDNRIRSTLQPLIAHGRFFIQPGMDELRHEIITFPMNPKKDLIDATASVCRMLDRPKARREHDAGHEAKMRYLRSSGAPAWYIEQESGRGPL